MHTPPALPNRIKLVESKRFIKVDLGHMLLDGDAGTVSLQLNSKCNALREQTAHSFRYMTLHALNGRRKTSTVTRWVNELDLFTRTVAQNQSIGMITLAMFNAYVAQKGASQQKLLRSALLYWTRLRLHGVAEDLENYLVTSASPRPRQTVEIQNSVEIERPFKLSEIRMILAAIDELYIDGRLDAQDNLMWRLIISEALRPSQLKLLKVGDVRQEDSAGGKSAVFLNVPIVKQSGTPARQFMFETRLSDSLSSAVRQQLRYLASSNVPLDPSLPLFCIRSKTSGAINIVGRIAHTRKLIAKHSGMLDDHEIFTRRFKHTKLTHLAILGAPLAVLARAGYQTTTISLRHYVNLTDEAFVDFEARMSSQHDRILDAFRGRIIRRENARKPDTQHNILSTDLENDVGACSDSPCGALAPIACYTCPRFEAFADGAHEVVLDFILQRQGRRGDISAPSETASRDAAVISAVQWVIKEANALQCDE